MNELAAAARALGYTVDDLPEHPLTADARARWRQVSYASGREDSVPAWSTRAGVRLYLKDAA